MSNEKKNSILVVDDEEDIGRVLGFLLKQKGYEVQVVQSGEEAIEIVSKRMLDLVITDIRMHGMDGIELLRRCRDISPSTAVIIMTAHASLGTAVEAIRLGAADYIEKPFVNDEMLETVSIVLQRQDEKRPVHAGPDIGQAGKGFIGSSPRIREVLSVVEKVAPTRSNVLILGESGTGKGMLAELIHANSPRKDKAFLSINCSAIPDTLLESELFGYRKGAFTGAVSDKMGLIVTADGGTLFLDEIGDMPVGTQSKLLQVIESGMLIPLGDTKPRSVDVRIVAATNRDLEERVKQGHFREDLFYRLDVIELSMPPLRARIEDIEPLMRHFLAQFAAQHKKPISGFADGRAGGAAFIRLARKRARTQKRGGTLGAAVREPRNHGRTPSREAPQDYRFVRPGEVRWRRVIEGLGIAI